MQERNSTFELLRIIAISFVTIHHIFVFGIGACHYNTGSDYIGYYPIVDNIVNSACVCGVNLFILITGWFGISSIRKSIIRLIPAIIFCTIFSCILKQDISPQTWGWGEWWFLTHFIILILISPIIEQSIKNISNRRFIFYIVLLCIVNIFYGRYRSVMNYNGYNYLNFIFLYYIARFLKRTESNRCKYYIFLKQYGVYLFLTIAILHGYLYQYVEPHIGEWGGRITAIWYYGYNSPFILIESICMFLWIKERQLKSKFVNFLAGGTFYVFLIGTKDFDVLQIGEFSKEIIVNYGYTGVFIYSLSLLILLFIPFAIVNFVTQKMGIIKILNTAIDNTYRLWQRKKN